MIDREKATDPANLRELAREMRSIVGAPIDAYGRSAVLMSEALDACASEIQRLRESTKEEVLAEQIKLSKAELAHYATLDAYRKQTEDYCAEMRKTGEARAEVDRLRRLCKWLIDDALAVSIIDEAAEPIATSEDRP
jgi:hypothetical protein